MSNPLIEVQKHGQSLWYDYISRDLLLSGELHRLVVEDGVLGVTSNPAIFEKAIGGSNDYDAALAAATAHGADDAQSAAMSSEKIQEWIAGKEIRKVIVREPNLVNIVV